MKPDTCTNCGNIFPVNPEKKILFCTQCGTPISATPQEIQNPQTAPPEQKETAVDVQDPSGFDDPLPTFVTQTSATASPNWVPLLVAGCVTLGAVGVGAGLYFVKQQDKEPTSQSTSQEGNQPEQSPSPEITDNLDQLNGGESPAEAPLVEEPTVDDGILRQEAYLKKLSELVQCYGILEEEAGIGVYDFGYLDFDGDGKDELLVLYARWGNYDGVSMAVYGYENNKISRIFYKENTLWAGNSAVSGESITVYPTDKGDFVYSLSGNGEDYLMGMVDGVLVELYEDGGPIFNLSSEDQARYHQHFDLAMEEWAAEVGDEPMSMARAKSVEMEFFVTFLDCYGGWDFDFMQNETSVSLNFGGSAYRTDFPQVKQKIMGEGVTLYDPVVPASQLDPEVASAYRAVFQNLPQSDYRTTVHSNDYVEEYDGELKVLFLSPAPDQTPLMFLGYFSEPWWESNPPEYVFAASDLGVWCYHEGQALRLDDPQVNGDYFDSMTYIDGEIHWGNHMYLYDVYGLAYSNYVSIAQGKTQQKLLIETLNVMLDEDGTVMHDEIDFVQVPILSREEYLASGWVLDDGFTAHFSATRVNGTIVNPDDPNAIPENHNFFDILVPGGTGPGGSCYHDFQDIFVDASTVLTQIP